MNCITVTSYGSFLRYIITSVTVYLLYINAKWTIIQKYKYAIIPVLLTLLDGVDSLFIDIYKINNNDSKCDTFSFQYQSYDKICDSVSYLLFFAVLGLDNIYLYFIIYRIIGVSLFYITKDSKWLILFFDFAKEYLLYIFLFGNNYKFMPFFILCKIAFEYYLHTYINKNNYREKDT